MNEHSVLALVLGASALLGGCKSEEDRAIELARSLMSNAQAALVKGEFNDAYTTCKLVDHDALRTLASVEGKKARADHEALCAVDVPAGEARAEIATAYKELQAAEASMAEFKKGRVESACASAKAARTDFAKYQGEGRPLATELAAEMAAHCSPEALMIKAGKK